MANIATALAKIKGYGAKKGGNGDDKNDAIVSAGKFTVTLSSGKIAQAS